MARARRKKISRAALLVNKADTENFNEPERPRFEGGYAPGPAEFGGELLAVSWNIMFSQEIDQAIAELGGRPELSGAGILLLQEMDEAGVDEIAGTLLYNYIYYPASVHCRTGRKFGNAVLAKWPITGTRKLILPHRSPRTGEIRVATRAHVRIDGRDVLVYSVHTETFALSAARRHEQFQALVDDIEGEEHRHVLVGGDFNTFKAKSIGKLEHWFAGVGLKRASTGARPTVKPGILGISSDHIFTRGLEPVASDVCRGTKASDHFPLWQRLRF